MREVGRFSLGLLMTAWAGWIDAVGLLEFGGSAPSYMSGNTIQLGLGSAMGDIARLQVTLGAIAAFALGAFAGGLMFGRAGRWTVSLALVLLATALCFATGLALGPSPSTPLALAPLAFAMGLQNQIVAKGRADNAGTTFVTGTLFRFGDALAQLLLGTDRSGRAARLLCVLAAFACGAVGGVFSALRYGLLSLALPAACAVMIAVAALGLEVGRALRRRADAA